MSDINANIDIEELFPELQGIISSWDTGNGTNGNGGNGNGFENENGVEPSEIEQAMQQRLASMPMPPQFQSGQTAPPPPPSHVEDGGPPATPTPAAPAAPAAPVESVQPTGQSGAPPEPVPPEANEVEIGVDEESGEPIRVPLSRLQAYAQFDRDFQNDPGLQAAVRSYYEQQTSGPAAVAPPASVQQPQPTQDPTQSPVTPTIPDGLDLDDPNIRFLIEQQQALANQVQMLAGGVQATQAQQQARQQAENDSLIRRAMDSFRKEHSLNDEQMQAIRVSAGRLNVVPSLMQGVDPITGAPSKPDPLTALDRAFEIAMMMNPEYRQREFSREIQQRVTDARRKQKLAGLSGSSGSVPRTTPAPTTAQGRRQAMIDEIRSMQEGGWSPPES